MNLTHILFQDQVNLNADHVSGVGISLIFMYAQINQPIVHILTCYSNFNKITILKHVGTSNNYVFRRRSVESIQVQLKSVV